MTTARPTLRGCAQPPASRRHAGLLALLTGLFALRVAGQAVQRWIPQAFLPAFEAFQGSRLPYWSLLSAQIVILAVMVRVCWRAANGTLIVNPRLGRILLWAGAVYMAGSLLRLLVGLAMPAAPAWFTAWIPAVFHVVLAGFVLTVARYHPRRPAS
ncbi:MAG TPA: hypothetical protein VNM24_04085 [Burkholderiales bacterium]|nr:hypothetical protein [Burkholderiales bacterium]